jgi:hypothetical protein
MEKDDHLQPRALCFGRSIVYQLAAVALAVAAVATTGFLMASWVRSPNAAEPPVPAASDNTPEDLQVLFRGWPKPDLALLLSGQQVGYLQPCGCSDPQLGGLARRYNLIQYLRKDHGWPIVAADLGDIPQSTSPQAKLKYKYSMEALKLLGYTAVGIGEREINMPLISILPEWALNDHSPRVVASSLVDKNKVYFDSGMVVHAELSKAENGVPRVGFISVAGPTLVKAVQAQAGDVGLEDYAKALSQVLAKLEQSNPEIKVLLFQGPPDEAKACAAKFPQFQIVLCECQEEQPSARHDQVGDTMVVSVGWKGRHVGVIGIYRTGKAQKPFELRYQLVEIGPVFETPVGQEPSNPIHELMDRYARDVKEGNYLAQYATESKHPLQINYPEATFVGSERCKGCHKSQYVVWEKHPHSHAYDTLVNKAKRPSLRQFDGECVGCHTIGFGYKSGFTNEEATPKLKNVGCESCHGPASLHVAKPSDEKLQAALNPIKRKPSETLEQFSTRLFPSCSKCHDMDNSTHFKLPDYWDKKKTAHPNEE